MKVGFIGLGNVGGKLAESLLRNKFDLVVRDLNKIDFRAKGFPSELEDNEPEEKGYEI